MSQILPPDPYGQTPPSHLTGAAPIHPVPFSALAIAAFVLSILGCLGFTAVLGLILGVAGILATRGGARRGMGLAIAAIPISLITGLLSVVAILFFSVAAHWAKVAQALPELYDAEGKVSMSAVAVVRDLFTDRFNTDISEEAFAEWLDSIRAEHGAFVEIVDVGDPSPVAGTNRMLMNVRGKFVSGPLDIALTIEVVPPMSLRIDDVNIGGSSPRAPN